MSKNRFTVGVDVGGTYTDIFVLDTESGEVGIAKVPTTLDDQSRALVAGIKQKIDNFDEITSVIHGTTTGTNALLERKGAKTGIITTRGFRDTLELRRRDRPKTWGLRGQFTPVVPRNLRREVNERTLADGAIETPVDPDDVAAVARTLMEEGCEALCIVFINSYANDENELRAAAAAREVWHNDFITVSSDVLPEIREFERTSTATLNAYLQPLISSYVARLDKGLTSDGFNGELLIVQSNGGLMSVDTTTTYPVRTALSGPAAGVRAAQAIAGAAGITDIITCDLGGTSFDVSLISKGRTTLAAQTEVEFGLVIRTPMIEITTIGAGGGSIARIDAGGLLQVGPESAGSDPGPVCYGLGNQKPTLTDANLVLGRINPDRPIGGKLDRLDMEAARKAIDHEIGKPLSLSTEAAAEAVLRVANARMADAIRLVSIERGHDPTRFFAMPFGGGGSLQMGALIKECGLRGALVPRYPGVTSALGCVVADMRHDRVKTVNQMTSEVDTDGLSQTLKAEAQSLQALLERAEAKFSDIEIQYELDMLYLGQSHTVAVPVAMPDSGLTQDIIDEAFDSSYLSSYGRLLDDIPTRIVNYRVAVIGHRPPFDMTVFAPESGKDAKDCITEMRSIFEGGTRQEVPVFDRLALGIGETVKGPCLLEQMDTTIFVDPGLVGKVDSHGNLMIERVQ
ncbi:MAG: hydantoinase/oxoprolinase family protein [Alphaproteobacteria bacterium]|jgi:N-methylhydantoinase A|nr:hydantoinase/oxoprolinase family protein [Alphaproteobacteria bacterium]MBT4082895.1 hydantoinase/oxoprolinase family protein [Alphaproteobacteria bacterium]MBT4546597.1 hydantoinase/oxoprolinase family protein [Alphaproteobacteria bacterium]MBT7747449.1 hydantoinase/oxoprolinase family protein [Alphaproteobacteria bacterium]